MKGCEIMRKETKYDKRRRIGVVICAILIAFALLASIICPAFISVADAASTKAELQKEVDAAKKKTEEAKKQLENVKKNKTNLSNEVLKIDNDINRAENELAATEQSIEAAKLNLAWKEQELVVAEANCKEQDDNFKTRARIMYENRTTSYLEVLLGSSSFGDFLSRVEMIREIVEYDKKVLNERMQARDAIAKAKEEIEQTKLTLEAKSAELETLKEELEYRLESKQLMLDQLYKDEEEYKKAYEKAEADEKKVQKELAALAAKEAKNGTTTKYTGSGKFTWPCPASSRITSYYGYRIHPVYKTKKFHSGIDIGAGYGSAIVAAESGTVITATYGSGYGKYVVVSHGSGITTLYAHCSSLLVNVGDKVTKGQTIAKVGSTGVSTGNHLHFEVRINGTSTDPLLYVK